MRGSHAVSSYQSPYHHGLINQEQTKLAISGFSPVAAPVTTGLVWKHSIININKASSTSAEDWIPPDGITISKYESYPNKNIRQQ